MSSDHYSNLPNQPVKSKTELNPRDISVEIHRLQKRAELIQSNAPKLKIQNNIFGEDDKNSIFKNSVDKNKDRKMEYEEFGTNLCMACICCLILFAIAYISVSAADLDYTDYTDHIERLLTVITVIGSISQELTVIMCFIDIITNMKKTFIALGVTGWSFCLRFVLNLIHIVCIGGEKKDFQKKLENKNYEKTSRTICWKVISMIYLAMTCIMIVINGVLCYDPHEECNYNEIILITQTMINVIAWIDLIILTINISINILGLNKAVPGSFKRTISTSSMELSKVHSMQSVTHHEYYDQDLIQDLQYQVKEMKQLLDKNNIKYDHILDIYVSEEIEEIVDEYQNLAYIKTDL